MNHSIFNEYDLLTIKSAYIKLVKNKQLMDKHAIGYVLSMIDRERFFTKSLYCQTYLRKELEGCLIDEIMMTDSAIKKVMSDYWASKIRTIINK